MNIDGVTSTSTTETEVYTNLYYMQIIDSADEGKSVDAVNNAPAAIAEMERRAANGDKVAAVYLSLR
jgi:hypothetical protein